MDLFPQRTVTNPVTSLNGDAKTPDHTPLTLTAHYQEVSNDIGYSTTALFWYIAPYCLQFIVALRITDYPAQSCLNTYSFYFLNPRCESDTVTSLTPVISIVNDCKFSLNVYLSFNIYS